MGSLLKRKFGRERFPVTQTSVVPIHRLFFFRSSES